MKGSEIYPPLFAQLLVKQVRHRWMGERRGRGSAARGLLRLSALRSVQQLRLHPKRVRRAVQRSSLLLELLRDMPLRQMPRYLS